MSSSIFEKFQQEVSSVNINGAEKMKEFFDNLSNRMTKFDGFTDLQLSAIKNDAFWDNEKNIILQGSTSSGKTLAAECAMANQILSEEKNVIYLVPLKALTTEKERDFQNDFKGKRIYSSSADYQEHDYDLMRGNYDIGILVYEKFFSLVAQSNSRDFLKKCGLIVIDEMHMLSDEERGPKLEYAIEKVRFCYEKKSPSILGLTTSECDMSEVRKWLDSNKTEIIENHSRPVDIEERFIYCDSNSEEIHINCWCDNAETGEKDEIESNNNFKFYDDIKIEKDDARFYQLLQVLKNHNTPEEKIIIFCNGRKKGEKLVQDICSSDVLVKVDVDTSGFPSPDESEMEASNYEKLRNALIKYGIVYHNSNHSLTMRNYIEDTFKKRENGIRIIVATETLTMGVNMPTDVMVLYDNLVYRSDKSTGGSGVETRMFEYQEYKNAVGRAGRYGITKNNRGISYILSSKPEEKEKLIKHYIKEPKKLKVISGLRSLENLKENSDRDQLFAMAASPFYLSVLNGQKGFDNIKLENIIENGLLKKDKYTCAEKIAEKIIDILKGKDEYTKHPPLYIIESDDDEDDDFSEITKYTILNYGKAISPYAVNMHTSYRIQKFFIETDENKVLKKHWDKHHLPIYDDNTQYEIVPDANNDINCLNYFFDIMYEICMMPEIRKKSQYVSVNKNDSRICTEIQKAVQKFFVNHKNSNLYWNGSCLYKYCEGVEIPENSIEAAYRVAVFYYWVQGFQVTEIRKKLNLPDSYDYYIYTSELQSLSEISAHIIEAISSAFSNTTTYNNNADGVSKKLKDMFYELSICIKYGMNRELARIAAKHIPRLTRSQILRMDKVAKEKGYKSAVEFLFGGSKNDIAAILSDEQYSKLIETLNAPLDYDYKHLLDTVQKELLVREYFVEKLDLFENDIDKLCELFELMGADADYGENNRYLYLKDYDLYVYVHYNSNASGADEIKRNVGFDTNREDNTIILYKGTIGEIDDKICLSVSDMKMMILQSVVKAGDYRKAGPYIAELLKRYNKCGNNLCNPSNMKIALEEIFDSLQKNEIVAADKNEIQASAPPQQTIIINGNTTINNIENMHQQNAETIQNISINVVNEYINPYREQLENTAQNWIYVTADYNDKISEATDEEEKDALYLEMAEKISLPEEIPEETIEKAALEILKEHKSEGAERILSEIKEVEGLDKIFYQALYVERAVTEIKLLSDYSPAITMYGKAIEHFLKKKVFPILKKDCPKYKLGYTLLNEFDVDELTIGKVDTILKKCYIDNKSNTAYLNKRIKFFKQSETNLWKELQNSSHKAVELRNPSSHSGIEMNTDSVKEMRECSFDIFNKNSALSDIAKE